MQEIFSKKSQFLKIVSLSLMLVYFKVASLQKEIFFIILNYRCSQRPWLSGRGIRETACGASSEGAFRVYAYLGRKDFVWRRGQKGISIRNIFATFSNEMQQSKWLHYMLIFHNFYFYVLIVSIWGLAIWRPAKELRLSSPLQKMRLTLLCLPVV